MKSVSSCSLGDYGNYLINVKNQTFQQPHAKFYCETSVNKLPLPLLCICRMANEIQLITKPVDMGETPTELSSHAPEARLKRLLPRWC